MEQNGGSRCNSDNERHVLQYLHEGGREYALINVKHSNAILEHLIMCIKVVNAKIAVGRFITKFQYLHMSIL
jgi:hypothetical protein